MTPRAVARGRPQLIWLLLDGLSSPLVRGFAERHPNSFMARCLRSDPGVTARSLSPLTPNCQTPPSLFTIWSGLSSEQHGLIGYDVARPSPDALLHYEDAFKSWPRDTAMAWDHAAAAGWRLRLCAIPFVQPSRIGEALISWSNPYGRRIVGPTMAAPGEQWIDDALGIHIDVERFGNSVRLVDRSTAEAADIEIAPGATFRFPIDAPATHAAEGLATCLTVNGQPHLVVFAQHERQTAGQVAMSPAWARCLGGDVCRLYQQGRFGVRLAEGGNGEAERHLASLLRLAHRGFAEDVIQAVRAGDADGIFAYHPVVDLLCHHLLRYVHPSSSKPLEREICEPLFDDVLHDVDELLSECAAVPATLFAHSDHGMLPVLQDVHANELLHELGLLQFDEHGIDLAHTAVFFHPCESGLIAYNPERLSRPLDEAVAALRAKLPAPLRDGWDVIAGPDAALPAPWISCCYLQAPPLARWRASRSNSALVPSAKGGEHCVANNDPWLQGVLLCSGEVVQRLPAGTLELASLSSLALPRTITHP